jgi:hypothetical protein
MMITGGVDDQAVRLNQPVEKFGKHHRHITRMCKIEWAPSSMYSMLAGSLAARMYGKIVAVSP